MSSLFHRLATTRRDDVSVPVPLIEAVKLGLTHVTRGLVDSEVVNPCECDDELPERGPLETCVVYGRHALFKVIAAAAIQWAAAQLESTDTSRCQCQWRVEALSLSFGRWFVEVHASQSYALVDLLEEFVKTGVCRGVVDLPLFLSAHDDSGRPLIRLDWPRDGCDVRKVLKRLSSGIS